MIKIKIMPNDTKTVAKVILLDGDKVLLLKRSGYVKKFANDWDLPGGHLKQNENLIKGLKREVFEETGIKIKDPVFFKNIENIHFFIANYNFQEIKLSDEHTEYKFFGKSDLNLKEKFQKVAYEAMSD
tara:strand:+ start:1218 stop:1601 length:384 start_codon:yes stop_codon:yes gene_type:complete